MKIKYLFLAVLLVLIITSLAAGLAYAQAGGYSLPWWTVDGGGGTSISSNYSLNGTIGQQEAGLALNGGNYQLEAGFWGEVHRSIYLPLVRR